MPERPKSSQPKDIRPPGWPEGVPLVSREESEGAARRVKQKIREQRRRTIKSRPDQPLDKTTIII